MQPHPAAPETNPEVARLLEDRREQIVAIWKECLTSAWGEKGPGTMVFLPDPAGKQDLLGCLVQSLRTGSAAKGALDAIVERLRLPHVSMADFLEEKSCLLDAVNTVLMESAGLVKGREAILACLHLQHIAGQILERTAMVYERVVKHGGRAFCQVDREGVIVYANPQMLRLVGCGDIVNQPLSPLFEDQDQEFINKALCPRPVPAPSLRVLHLTSASGVTLPVGAELAPIMIDGRHHGGYASMVDISGPMGSMLQVMEQTPLGIIKINARHEVTYANPRAQELAGAADDMKGVAVERLFPDPENRDILQREVRKRFENGRPSEYPVEITRLDDGRRIPVMIAATPERDPHGTIIGSMAIIRSMELERAAERINQYIATCLDTDELLQKVTGEIAAICPFDMIAISAYSKNLQHVRSVFSHPRMESRFRWWRMPPSLMKWIQNRASEHIDDFEEFLSRPDWQELRERPEIKGILQSGLHSMIRCPVWDREEGKGALVASLTIFRRGKGAFSLEDRMRLKALPLVKTILATRLLDEKRKLSFRFDLIKKILASCDDMKKVADLIASELVGFYGWNNVSIFKIDEKNKHFRLLSQKAKDDDPKYLLPSDYSQPFELGVLGHVRQTGKPIFSGNIKEDTDIIKHYLPGYEKESNSELCVPIMASGRPFWLLNIEDPQENAFSSDEVEELQMVHGEIGTILERAFQHHLLRATLEYASDAIIVTDDAWQIRRFNPAVRKLLGYPDAEKDKTPLERLFVDQGVLQWLKKGGQIPGQEIEMRHKNGDVVTVYLSTAELPREMGGAVLIAKDLSAVKRLEELDFLGKLYYEIAIQTKTPLSLLFSWLKRLQGAPMPEDCRDTLLKALKQLRKLTLTYDRLALYDEGQGLVPYRPLLFDVAEILELLSGEFPQTEWQKVVVRKERHLPLLRGDLFQLTFCFETILSYLLRAASEEGLVTISVGHQDGRIVISLRGAVAELTQRAADRGVESSAQLAETVADMALGDKVIHAFIGNHGGTYTTVRDGNELVFRIALNAAPERSML